MPTIAERILEAEKAGVPKYEIERFKKESIQKMIDADFPQEQINKELNIDQTKTRNDIKLYWSNLNQEIEKDITDGADEKNIHERIQTFLLGDDKDYQFLPYFKRAIGQSGLNKMIAYHSKREFGLDTDYKEIEGTGFLEKLTEGATGLVAELPTFVPGAVVGGFTGGPGGAVIGGGLSAGAIQGVYTEALKRGEVKGWSEWWDMFVEEGLSEGGKTAAKLYAAYAVPGLKFAAPLQKNILGRTLTQSTAFTGTGMLLGDDLPTAEDFAVTSLLFAPFNIKPAKEKLDNMVSKTGKKPIEMLEEGFVDRSIFDFMNSKLKDIHDVPPNYRNMDKVGNERFKKEEVKEYKEPKELDQTRQKLDESIKNPEEGPMPKRSTDFVDNFFYHFVDKFNVFKRAEKLVEKRAGSKKLFEKEITPYESFQLESGIQGQIQFFMREGALDFKTKQKVGPSMREAFENVKSEKDVADFRRYLVAKRAIEKNAQGIKTGVDIPAAKKFVKEMFDKFEIGQKKAVQNQQLLLKYLVDSKIMPQAVYKKILEMNKDFTPFYRDFLDTDGGIQFSKNVKNPFNPVKEMKGSDRKIIDPITSMYNNINLFIQIAERNQSYNNFLKFVENARKLDKTLFPEVQKSEMRTIRTQVTRAELEQAGIIQKGQKLGEKDLEHFSIFRKEQGVLKETEIVVYREVKTKKGKTEIKREVWEVGEAFARPLKDFSKSTWLLGNITDALAVPAKTLRAGATGALEFMYNNVQRDAFQSAVLSKGWYPPFFQTMMGSAMMIKPLRNKFGNHPVWEKYVKSGALQNSLVTLDRTYFNKSIREHFTNTKAINVIKNPIEMFRVYLEFSEGLNRSGNFKLAYERNIKKGMSEEVAIKKAAVETRDNPIDYRRMGASIEGANKLSAFFNARIQGLNQTVKAFKDRPIQTSIKTFLYVSLPSIILWFQNHDDPDYQDLPQWRKDLFWHIKVNGTYYPVPKPFELGLIFGTGAERFLDYYIDDDPKAFEKMKNQFTQTTLKQLLPVPTAMTPFIETTFNKSWFYDKPVIPAFLEGIPSEYQYTSYTSETAKKVAAAMGYIIKDDFSKLRSPLVLENAWRGVTGSIGQYITFALDEIQYATGLAERQANRKKMLGEYPILKAFFIKYPDRNAAPITEVKELYEPVKARLKAKTVLEERNMLDDILSGKVGLQNEKDIELIKAIKAIGDLEDMIREVQEKDLTPEDKLDLTKKFMFAMIDISKYHLNSYYGKKVYNIRGIDNPRKGMEDVKIGGNVLEGIIGYEGNDLLK